VCVSSQPAHHKVLNVQVFCQTGTLPLKSGILKVVIQSQAQYVVPITQNSVA